MHLNQDACFQVMSMMQPLEEFESEDTGGFNTGLCPCEPQRAENHVLLVKGDMHRTEVDKAHSINCHNGMGLLAMSLVMFSGHALKLPPESLLGWSAIFASLRPQKKVQLDLICVHDDSNHVKVSLQESPLVEAFRDYTDVQKASMRISREMLRGGHNKSTNDELRAASSSGHHSRMAMSCVSPCSEQQIIGGNMQSGFQLQTSPFKSLAEAAAEMIEPSALRSPTAAYEPKFHLVSSTAVSRSECCSGVESSTNRDHFREGYDNKNVASRTPPPASSDPLRTPLQLVRGPLFRLPQCTSSTLSPTSSQFLACESSDAKVRSMTSMSNTRQQCTNREMIVHATVSPDLSTDEISSLRVTASNSGCGQVPQSAPREDGTWARNVTGTVQCATIQEGESTCVENCEEACHTHSSQVRESFHSGSLPSMPLHLKPISTSAAENTIAISVASDDEEAIEYGRPAEHADTALDLELPYSPRKTDAKLQLEVQGEGQGTGAYKQILEAPSPLLEAGCSAALVPDHTPRPCLSNTSLNCIPHNGAKCTSHSPSNDAGVSTENVAGAAASSLLTNAAESQVIIPAACADVIIGGELGVNTAVEHQDSSLVGWSNQQLGSGQGWESKDPPDVQIKPRRGAPCLFSLLDQHLMDRVFSHLAATDSLTAVAAVCRRFRYAARRVALSASLMIQCCDLPPLDPVTSSVDLRPLRQYARLNTLRLPKLERSRSGEVLTVELFRLRMLTQLTYLDIQCAMCVPTFQPLRLLPSLRHLLCAGATLNPPPDLPHLPNCEIMLYANRGLSAAARGNVLSSLPPLSGLRIASRAPSALLQQIGSCPSMHSLTYLRLGSCNAPVLGPLAPLTGLVRLHLHIIHGQVAPLTTFTLLTYLHLHGTTDDLPVALRSFHSLQKLSLIKCKRLRPDEVRAVGTLTSLTSLELPCSKASSPLRDVRPLSRLKEGVGAETPQILA